jgi:hypothetical protein
MINSNSDQLQPLAVDEALWNCFERTRDAVSRTKAIAFLHQAGEPQEADPCSRLAVHSNIREVPLRLWGRDGETPGLNRAVSVLRALASGSAVDNPWPAAALPDAGVIAPCHLSWVASQGLMELSGYCGSYRSGCWRVGRT